MDGTEIEKYAGKTSKRQINVSEAEKKVTGRLKSLRDVHKETSLCMSCNMHKSTN